MALDFPSSPAVGQLYPSPPVAGTPVWKWDGSEWVVSSGNNSAALNQFEYSASAGQTAFSGLDINNAKLAYAVGFIEVFVNGLKVNKSDYTATDGSTVTLGAAVNSGDLVTITAFAAVSVSNTLAPANNLSDLSDKNAARTNLGLGPYATAAQGQLPGGSTSAPGAGMIGERIANSGTSAALSSGATGSVCSITLTTGVWDIDGYIQYGGPGATTSNNWYLILTGPSGNIFNVSQRLYGGTLTADSGIYMTLARQRVTVTAASAVYTLNGQASVSGSSYTASGTLAGTRVS